MLIPIERRPEERRAQTGRGAKVVLFLPPYEGAPLGPPVGLLAVAAPLLEAGYRVRIVDAAVVEDYRGEVEREIKDAVCFGVSLLTGPMIRGAVETAKALKRLRPELPIVFGGWHPTLLPEQTLREPFVDAVVRRQGEITFREVVERIAKGESLEGVAGCSYKRGGEVRSNPERPAPRLEDLPAPAYSLVDFDAYERAGGGRKLPYATSVGCPYACRYCTDMVFYNRRFNAYSAERAVGEVVELVERHRLTEVSLLDSNFLVDVKRAVAVARGFRDSGARFRWTFQASTDLLCRMTDEEVRLLAESGVRHIGFGTESASEDVLRAMAKTHQKVADMFEAARKCEQAGIRATFNLIFGFPGETEADRTLTLRVMGEIAERHGNVTFSPNVFTPYPGIPAWEELERLGVRPPETLEGWREMSLGAAVLPWIKGRPMRRLKRAFVWFDLANELSKRSAGAARGPLRRAVAWRLKRGFYGAPIELWAYRLGKRVSLRRSLLTGARLPSLAKEAF